MQPVMNINIDNLYFALIKLILIFFLHCDIMEHFPLSFTLL